MRRRSPLARALRLLVVGAVACVLGRAHAADGIVVIGHAGMAGLDAATLERIYKGRVIELNGTPIVAVNFAAGSSIRSRFLHDYLNVDEDDYTGYWLVRRYVGKGAPPREIGNSAAIINFVKSTPGAIAYDGDGATSLDYAANDSLGNYSNTA